MNRMTSQERILMWSVVTLLLAAITTLQQSYGQEKSVLTEHYVLDTIRVFYAIDGKSAVPVADTDSSGVPDHVEDVAKQVWAAHRLFCDVLEFPNPLKSERHTGVTCIEVSIRDRSEIGDVNGVAFEQSQRARRIPEGKPDDRTIVIAVARNVVASRNLTPAHELFHLIQYGATFFKKGWFLEGQARWSEHALGESGLGEVKYSTRGPWPQQPMNLAALFAMGYDAEFALWNPIAMATDPKGVLPQTPLLKELGTLRYSDGSPVLEDPYLTGADVMREILVELGNMDDVAFKELGYDEWSEDNQKSPKNDSYIYQSIMDVFRRRSRSVGRFQVTSVPTTTPGPDRTTPDNRDGPRTGRRASVSADASEDLATEAAKWRTWTTRDGKYTLEAKFVKYAVNTLTLEKRDGTTVNVKLEVLCAEDQDFVRQRKWLKVGDKD